MRAIILGSELISLSAACHLAQLGYDVTLIDSQSEISAKQPNFTDSLDNQLLKQKLETEAREYNVKLRYSCHAEQFITQGNRIRGVVITNENHQTETLMADRFIAAIDFKGNPLLQSVGIMSPADLTSFNSEHSYNPLIGKSYYANLFLNINYSNIGSTVITNTAKLLTSYMFNPALEQKEPSFTETLLTGLSALVNVFKPAERSVA